MKRATKSYLIAACAAGALLTAGAASASLSVFQTYTGNVGLSTGGFGSLSQAGDITANVPVGSTVVAAYLYSSTFSFGSPFTPTGTFNGNAVTYTPLGATGCCSLQAGRADVTSIVAAVINGGPGGAYNFHVTEGESGDDGEALVVVYSNGALAVSSIGILDGFSTPGGDASSISFGSPLHPAAPGFQAEMRIADGFSCCGQETTITVNGQVLTDVAGNNDDSVDGTSNGNLFTVGGDNDPFTVTLPGSPAEDYSTDHERYNLAPFITDGDTSINLHTFNATGDDNIFLEVFQVTGEAVFHGSTAPEPATWAMMLMGFFGLGAMLRRRQTAATTA